MNIEIKTQEAIAFFGSVTRLAETLNISPAAVRQWGDFIPELSAWKLRHKLNKHKFRRNKITIKINV